MDKILAELAAQIDKLGTAAWDQAPLVYRDIITAGLIKYGLGSILGAIMLAVAFHFGRKARAAYLVDEDMDDAMPFVIITLFALLIGMPVFCACVPQVLSAWLAPRAYLIDYLR